MIQFKKKLQRLYPELNNKQLQILIGAYNDGLKEEIIMQFAHPSYSEKIMGWARADAMDGYFVNTWLDRDFSEEQMRIKREQIKNHHYEKVKMTM